MHGREVSSWQKARPTGCDTWWLTDYPTKYSIVPVISDYELSDKIVEPNCTEIICRPDYVPAYRKLYWFLVETHKRGIAVTFAEVLPAIAIRLHMLISRLRQTEHDFNVFCPIITDGYSIQIPGATEETITAYIQGNISDQKYWWNNPEHVIKNPIDVFRRCKQFDSIQFWKYVHNVNGAFVHENVKWVDEITLRAGYLLLTIALRNSSVRKILSRRLITTCHLFSVARALPATDAIRYIIDRIEWSSQFDETRSGQWAVVGNVLVTGGTTTGLKGANNDSSKYIYLPILVYPSQFIIAKDGSQLIRAETIPHVIDWFTESNSNNSKKDSSSFSYLLEASDENLKFNAIESPEKAFKTWQGNGLLKFGHTRYGKHHYLAWIDLLGFVNRRSGETNEMLNSLQKIITDNTGCSIFYIPHEVTEVLVDRLAAFSAGDKVFEKQITDIIPIEIHSIASIKSMIESNARSSLFAEMAKVNSTALIIDDAIVTGKTIEEAAALLRGAGFKTIIAFVLLDRRLPSSYRSTIPSNCDTLICWWNFPLPPIGDDRACPICSGNKHLSIVATMSSSTTVSNILRSWYRQWSEHRIFWPLEKTIRETPLPSTLTKKLGSKQIAKVTLHTNVAVATWALLMTSSLRHFSYISSHEKTETLPARTAICAGAIVSFWQELSISQRERLLSILIDALWSEKDNPTRILSIISLMSLVKHDAEIALSIYQAKIIANGLPDLYCALGYYAILGNTTETPVEIANRLKGCSKVLMCSKVPDNEKEISCSLLRSLCASAEPQGHLTAIQSLGLPVRKPHHVGIQVLLNTIIKEAENNKIMRDHLFQLRIMLEPIRSLLEERKLLLEKEGVLETTEIVFNKFDSLFSIEYGHPSVTIDKLSSSDLSNIFQSIYNYLFTGASGAFSRSIRNILEEYYIHYIPFHIRHHAEHFKTHFNIPSSNIPLFMVANQMLEEEQILLNENPITPNRRSQQMRKLFENDVVCIEGVRIDSIIHDLMSDVEHPLKRSKPILIQGSRCYQYISFSPVITDGRQYLQTDFKNFALPDEFESSYGRSFSMASDLASLHNGKLSQYYDKENCILSRTLLLPLFKRRSDDII